MAQTNRFALEAFGPEGRISDNAHKFSLRDRHTIDALLWTLFNHDHRPTGFVTPLRGPSNRPVLSASEQQGTIPAGTGFHYAISFMDRHGNETEASIPSFFATPAPLAPPEAQSGSAALTGGNLEGGTYRYALAFYQESGGVTRAPNHFTVILPATSEGVITIDLGDLPDGADGWHVYRRDPASDDFYFLAEVPAPASVYVDDGSQNPDCTRKRPTTNTTNADNSILIELAPQDIPLDTRVTAWRIYRSETGVFSGQNLLATITDTETEGGTDLVSRFVDTGLPTTLGAPLSQPTVPPPIPTLDASEVFGASSGYLPKEVAPQGVRQFQSMLLGELTDSTVYNRVKPPVDMRAHRVDVFLGTAPDGADGNNHGIIRLKDDSTQNAVQRVWTDARSEGHIRRVQFNGSPTSGTWRITVNGNQTDPIDLNATTFEIAAAIEALPGITTVFVTGLGLPGDPFLIQFIDPPTISSFNVSQNFDDGGIQQGIHFQGTDGGDFILVFDGESTDGIDWDADAATIKSELEALTGITEVNVTGSGTEEDPWEIEFVNPGSVDVPILGAFSDWPEELNGSVYVQEVAQGHGPTTLEIPLDSDVQHFEWVAPETEAVVLEAEEIGHTGDEVNDVAALNDVAVELNGPGYLAEEVLLQPGRYEFRAYLAGNGEALMMVSNVSPEESPPESPGPGGAGSGDIRQFELTIERTTYEPPYVLRFEIDKPTNVEFRVENEGGGTVRVDRLSYSAILPTFHEGATLDVEVEVVGTPTSPGSDAQVSLWY